MIIINSHKNYNIYSSNVDDDDDDADDDDDNYFIHSPVRMRMSVRTHALI